MATISPATARQIISVIHVMAALLAGVAVLVAPYGFFALLPLATNHNPKWALVFGCYGIYVFFILSIFYLYLRDIAAKESAKPTPARKTTWGA